MTGALIVCLVGTQWNGTLFASDEQASSSEAPSSQTLTKSTSEARMFTSRGRAPAISIDEDRTAATDVSSVSPTFIERSRFPFKDEVRTANSPMGSIGHTHGTFDFRPTQSSAFAGQVYRGQPRPIRRGRDGSIAAIVIGAVASITGAAILVYANRPECNAPSVCDRLWLRDEGRWRRRAIGGSSRACRRRLDVEIACTCGDSNPTFRDRDIHETDFQETLPGRACCHG